jgi:hypothetical protein
VVDLDLGLARLGRHLERPVLEVLLDVLLVKLATDKPLGVEDGVAGVLGRLVLGRIADETLVLSEGDPRGGDPVTWRLKGGEEGVSERRTGGLGGLGGNRAAARTYPGRWR